MASLILTGDSLPRHKEMTRRHMRKCSKTPGAAPYGERIKPLYDKLSGLQSELDKVKLEIQDGYDDIELADTFLDDAVRDLFDLITIADRNNTGMPLLPKIFPEGKFGYIVDSPYAIEIDEVKKIIDRLNEADTDNSYTDNRAKLSENMQDVEQSIEVLKEKLKSHNAIKSETEIVKSDLRWQYEVNYLDARKQMGRKRAELLFPKKSNNTKKIVEESEEL